MREFILSTLIHSRTYVYIQEVFLIVTENMNSRRHNQIRTSYRLGRIDVSVMFSPFSKKKGPIELAVGIMVLLSVVSSHYSHT
jgi:hypothetical protein